MKKLLIACLILVSLSAFSQTSTEKVKTTPVSYSLVDGKVTATTKATKQPDKVFAVVDGVTFYQGSKGGVYYFAVNKEGEKVKRYVKQK